MYHGSKHARNFFACKPQVVARQGFRLDCRRGDGFRQPLFPGRSSRSLIAYFPSHSLRAWDADLLLLLLVLLLLLLLLILVG